MGYLLPQLYGRWVVATIIREGWEEEEMEERAGYENIKQVNEQNEMSVEKCWDCPFKTDVSTNEGVKWLCNITKKVLYITKCVKKAIGG